MTAARASALGPYIWTRSFMRERRVRTIIDGGEEEELEVSAGSSVSPILFIIYVSGVN